MGGMLGGDELFLHIWKKRNKEMGSGKRGRYRCSIKLFAGIKTKSDEIRQGETRAGGGLAREGQAA